MRTSSSSGVKEVDLCLSAVAMVTRGIGAPLMMACYCGRARAELEVNILKSAVLEPDTQFPF